MGTVVVTALTKYNELKWLSTWWPQFWFLHFEFSNMMHHFFSLTRQSSWHEKSWQVASLHWVTLFFDLVSFRTLFVTFVHSLSASTSFYKLFAFFSKKVICVNNELKLVVRTSTLTFMSLIYSLIRSFRSRISITGPKLSIYTLPIFSTKQSYW